MRKAALSFAIVSFALLASPIYVATAQQAQNEAASALAEKKKGQVIVAGAVQSPQRIIMLRRVRLLEALTVSGGLTRGARGIVQLIHADGTFETLRFRNIKGDGLKANPHLQAGDVISVF